MLTLEEISGCRVTRRAGPPLTSWRDAAVERRCCPETPLRLRSDPLAEVLRFSDFGAVFACVAASRALRGAIEQLSPKLQYELVINRYPILATISCGSDAALEPRELYESQRQLVNNSTLDFGPRLGLDGYVFSIEIEQGTPEMRGNSERRKPGGMRSAHVGTGTVRPADDGSPVDFDVPAGLWVDLAHPQLVEEEPHWMEWRVTIMASRRGTHSRAILYRGWMEKDHLERLSMPMGGGGRNYWGHQSEAFGWLRNENGWECLGKSKPALDLSWKLVDPQLPEGRSTIEAQFKWVCSDHNRHWDPDRMWDPSESLEPRSMCSWGACLTLELWCGLRPPERPRDFGPEMYNLDGKPTQHALAVMDGKEKLDRRWYQALEAYRSSKALEEESDESD
jgi:hypothetical protein